MAKQCSCCSGGEHRSDVGRERAVPRPRVDPTGSVSYSIAAYATRVRPWLGEDAVDRRAQELHARNSFDAWTSLSDNDQELWRHMARMDLTT